MLSKVFKAYDVRGTYPDPLGEDVAWKIGFATARFLRSKIGGREVDDPMLQHLVVGRDMRPSSPKLTEALTNGIRAAGTNVIDLGLVDTPFIYFAINHLDCAGGVQVTASHNPAADNGFKISGRHALPIGSGSGLVDIQRIAATIDDTSQAPVGRLEQRNLWEDYAKHVQQFLDLQRPLSVVVDASNGMAGQVVPQVFEKTKNLKISRLNFEMHGEFAHPPDPLVPENLQPLQEAVRRKKADVGICFDGDADRCILCDENGEAVGCDLLGARVAERFLAGEPGAAIVYDLRSSKALPETIEAAGGQPVRSRVGHVFMKAKMREHDACFGAELSGHSYFRSNSYTDSGAIGFASALSALSAQKKPMSQWVGSLKKYRQSSEQNFRVDDKDGMLQRIRDAFQNRATVDELDGVTVDAMEQEGWWFNLRKSNTEPLLRLNLEATDDQRYDQAYRQLTQWLGQPLKGH